MRKMIPLLVGACLAGSGLAYAQTAAMKPDDIIAARQAGYDLMAGTLIGMKAAIDANQDVKQLVDSSKALASWGRVIPTVFPDGTQSGHNTKARPEIWSDRAGFEKAAATLVSAADKLAQLAEANDKSGFASQYTVTTQACGGCHRNYRAR